MLGPLLGLSWAVCAWKKIRIICDPTDEPGAHHSPSAESLCCTGLSPPCDTPTRDAHLGSCLSFIAQEVGIAEAGWCSTKLSGYQSKAIAVSCIHRLPLCTAMYTNTHTGPSPRCTLSGGSSGGGIQVRGRGLILPSPTAPGAPATSQAGNRGNMGSLGQTHEPSRGQMCPDCDPSPQGCCGAPAPSNTPLKY